MTWYAKPSGSYSLTTNEAQSNIFEVKEYFEGLGYSIEAISGILGNMCGESGLNPWRWQSEKVSMNLGYGLFQFTPARSYIDGAKGVPNYAPNMSSISITSGANPKDALAQLTVFATDALGKWSTRCWRSYWDKTKYSVLFANSQRILETYGYDGRLRMGDFKNISSIWDSTFAFLACYEGPAVPNMGTRYGYALQCYQIMTGEEPDSGVPDGGWDFHIVKPKNKIIGWLRII